MQGEGNLPPLAAELHAETQGRSAAEVCTERSSRIFSSVVEEDWGYSLQARGAELPLAAFAVAVAVAFGRGGRELQMYSIRGVG